MKKPVVVNDKIEIKSIMRCVNTYDHRFGDAGLTGKYFSILKDYIEDPENFNLDKYPDSIPYSERTKKE